METMNRHLVLSIIALVLISSFCIAYDTVENVKPQITVVFGEDVKITSYSLENSDTKAIFPVSLYSQSGMKTFVFLPSKSLNNGLYKFTVFAEDLVGNPAEYNYFFNVYVPETEIILVEPNSIGVANSTRFRVLILTPAGSVSQGSVCKYTGVPVDSFDDIRLRYFDETGNVSNGTFVNEHIINDFSVEPDFPRHLYVICKDELLREKIKHFVIYSDVTPPSLRSVAFDPSPVVEYPPVGDLFSVLKISASEPVICKYTQDENATYVGMTPFSVYDRDNFDAYKEQNYETMLFPGDIVTKTFTFYVQCEDRARWKSVVFTRPVTIDLSAGLQIRVNSPPAFSKNTSVFLNVTTNMRSFCLFKSADPGMPASFTDPGATMSSSFESLSTLHYKNLGTKSSGRYTLSIRCEVPQGVGIEQLPATIDYAFAIDTVPPLAPKVNATSPVCSNVLSAKFVANDSLSGISAYKWAVGTGGKVVANGTTADEFVSVSKTNNGTPIVMAAGSNYVFNVNAVDGAGNEGPVGISNQIAYDATGVSCDKVPPVVTVTKSETGDSATINCLDNSSGCNSIGSFYGASYVQPCNSTQYFIDPSVTVPLFKTTIICWAIKDKAGNLNSGSQIVTLNTSELQESIAEGTACIGGVDNDGDGYGQGCLMGNDCNDVNASETVGCANGCVQDGDGDGYGTGCISGNDCNDKDAELTTKCPNGCISDNDGDGYGLGCNNGPDCKGDDSTLQTNCPNGCVDDNDGDSYGLGCPIFDCNGENYLQMTGCENMCIQDTDGDNYGMNCLDGQDCSGRNPSTSVGCDNGCIFDEDQDGYGLGCNLGIDCNGMHPFLYVDCPNGCISDNDGDGYGWGCENGRGECNDTNSDINLICTETTDCLYDHDGDGYGLGCKIGHDCDDYNINITSGACSQNCTYDEDCNRIDNEWQSLYFNGTVCNETDVCGPEANPDGDEVPNIEEYRRDTNPLAKDELVLPREQPSEAVDDDGDGMPDSCEKMYGLDSSDPYDANKDQDGDGLKNMFECNYDEGMCMNYLDPSSADTDNDGYEDKAEIDAGTDPCDSDSKPSGGILPIILMILGLLSSTGSVGYIIYKKYYIPLISPPPRQMPQAQAQARPSARPLAQQQVGGVHHAAPLHIHKHPSADIARQRFNQELQKRATEREKLLSVFGARKPIEKKPSKVMEDIARKPVQVRTVSVTKPAVQKKQAADDYVSKLSKVAGEDYFDKMAGMSKKEADYFGKLTSITQKKNVPLDEDEVSKLASIAKKVVDGQDKDKKKEVEEAFKKSDIEELESFLDSKKKVETFVKEEEKGAEKKESFPELSKISEGKDIEAFSDMSKKKRQDIIDELSEITSKKGKEQALEEMDALSEVKSKKELFKVVEQMSKGKRLDKNVFEVIISYLLKAGKISKSDVSELLFDLEKQGVLEKKDVSEVFFNLNIKR